MKNKTLCAMVIFCGIVVTLAIGAALGINHALHADPFLECSDLSQIGKILAWEPCKNRLEQ